MYWLPATVLSFLCGSIPFGFLLGKLRGVDIREHGSRNIGATNVARVLGRPLGVLCFLLDALKGALPVAITGAMLGLWGRSASELGASQQWLWLLTAFAALMGHMFSPWIGFRGGKGVATGFGALCAMWPLLTTAALIALGVWVASAAISRYVSLSSMLAAWTIPVVVAVASARSSGSAADGLAAAWPLLLSTGLLALLILWKHRANIRRLRAGTEPRIGEARPPSTAGAAPPA
jgi:glycerol-3-phosphate acyltransferase PlsY